MDVKSQIQMGQFAANTARADGVLQNPGQVKPQGDDARTRAQLRKSAEDFEAIFLEIVLKSMRESVQKSGLVDGGNAEDIYRSMLDGEYAKTLAAQRNTGLSASIESQLLASAGLAKEPSSLTKDGVAAYKKASESLGADTLRPQVKQATMGAAQVSQKKTP
jgi:Rod binding domain-containing protein